MEDVDAFEEKLDILMRCARDGLKMTEPTLAFILFREANDCLFKCTGLEVNHRWKEMRRQ